MNRFDSGHQLSLKEKKTMSKMTENQSYNPGESQWWVTGSLGGIKKNLQLPSSEYAYFLAFSSGSSRNTKYSCYVSRFPTLVWKLQSSSFICNMELHIKAYIRVHIFLSALPGTCFYSLVFERRSCYVVQAGDWNSLEPDGTWTQDRLLSVPPVFGILRTS